jgi:hypothetical protein
MITTNAAEQTTNTELQAQDAIDTLPPVALDDVNGGWLYSPYAVANPYNPYFAANPYAAASPYAAARYEAHLERRAAWYGRSMGWWY